jgi:hypothetical protein
MPLLSRVLGAESLYGTSSARHDSGMLSGKMLGIVLALIGLIVITLSAAVIYFSTSPR